MTYSTHVLTLWMLAILYAAAVVGVPLLLALVLSHIERCHQVKRMHRMRRLGPMP